MKLRRGYFSLVAIRGAALPADAMAGASVCYAYS